MSIRNVLHKCTLLEVMLVSLMLAILLLRVSVNNTFVFLFSFSVFGNEVGIQWKNHMKIKGQQFFSINLKVFIRYSRLHCGLRLYNLNVSDKTPGL